MLILFVFARFDQRSEKGSYYQQEPEVNARLPSQASNPSVIAGKRSGQRAKAVEDAAFARYSVVPGSRYLRISGARLALSASFLLVNHAHEDSAGGCHESYDRGGQTQPGDSTSRRKRRLHPSNTLLERFTHRRCVHAGRFLEQ